MVLETAANGGADAIVTFKRRDFIKVSDQFGLEVLSLGAPLASLEKRS